MRRMKSLWVLGGLLAASLAAALPLRAQEDTDLGPVPSLVSLYLLERPTVSVSFQGAHGPVRVLGTLDRAPEELPHLRSLYGVPRETRWTEIRNLSIVEYPREGMPAGTYQVALVSDPIPAGQVAAITATRDYTTQTGAWSAARLPEGELTLSGAPYGTLAIPLSRVTSMQMEPIRGNVTQFPQGQVRVEVVEGRTINVPLQDLLTLQRDQARGTVAVTLVDGQVFTGRLVELPDVNVSLTTQNGMVTVPLSRVSYLERTAPGGRLQQPLP